MSFNLTTSAVAASIAFTGGIQTLLCSQCNTPVAQLIGGYLIIQSKHHGERHTTVFNLTTLGVNV